MTAGPPLSVRRTISLGLIVAGIGVLPTAALLYGFARMPELLIGYGGLIAWLVLSRNRPRTRYDKDLRRATVTVVGLSIAVGAVLAAGARAELGYAGVRYEQGTALVSIVGPIRKRAAGEVIRELWQWPGPVRICADTSGGDVMSAMILAKYMRARQGGASISALHCDSACALLWAAAGQREVVVRPGDSRATALGLHRVQGVVPVFTDLMQSAYNETMEDYGTDERTVLEMMKHTAIWELMPDELRASGIPGEVVSRERFVERCR